MTKNADVIFCFNEGPRAATTKKVISKSYTRAKKSQTSRKAFSWDDPRYETIQKKGIEEKPTR